MQSRTTQPQQLSRDQVSPGCWYAASRYLPPNGLKVLVAREGGGFWVDWLRGGEWCVDRNGSDVAWQLPTVPTQAFFDIEFGD